MSEQLPTTPRQPSIYERLMPLMYALIGAAAAMFLNVLFCGRPVVVRDAKCKPAPAGATRVAAAATRSRPDAAPGARRDARRDSRRPDADSDGASTTVTPHAADAASPVETQPASRPSEQTAEALLSTAISDCLRAEARSFRLAVRLHPDGRTRRVFVGRDHGVDAAMIDCIEREVSGMWLPLTLPKTNRYAEWRVRQTDGKLSWTMIRPRRR